MNWIKQAFTNINISPNTYYCAITPVEFYEWRFNASVPAGVKLHSQMLRSDLLADNKIIASIQLPNFQRPKESIFKLEKSVPASITLASGSLQSPKEIIAKFAQIGQDFERKLQFFKQNTETQRYFTSGDSELNLYRVAKSTNDQVHLELLGKIKDIKKKFGQKFDQIGDQTSAKKGRAYELEQYRKYENYLMFIENSAMSIDGPKMDYLLTIAQIKPQQTRTIPWDQCFIEVSAEAKNLRAQIDLFNSMKWVKHSQHHIASLN
jgi:hypothetical protein